ncbi:hypothetical protein [Bosea lathyri]|uniref:Major tropism determinant N-terminal domain-containing protein n=1 Tax=Bosea lathyri TaxID=1036778 RepID=A0A1H6BVT0_9HYPH|nr:hypothetical protein [Bosea lathyri]SEG64814.1 hypothetical protein SAMN04488115_108129 [Bosea lathyri]
MARTPRRFARGTTAEVAAYTGLSGEPIWNTQTGRLHMQNGATAGGVPHALKSEIDVLSPVGGGLTVSAAAGALTIALVTLAGNTPTATDVVTLMFRSATANVGALTTRVVSAASSLVLSSGSTLGVPAINTPFALWVVAFDDAGTVRLGVVNCLSGKNIYPLGKGQKIASSTAEGGAGGADSNSIFYTGTAVAAKAYTILGRLSWEVGLTALGTWVAPTFVELWQAGMKLPGDVVQSISATDTTATSASGTTKVVTTTTASIALTSAANLVRTRASGPALCGTNTQITATQLSRTNTFTAVGNIATVFSTAQPTYGVAFMEGLDAPGVTTSVAYFVFVWGSGIVGTVFTWLPSASALGAVTGVISLEELQT